MSRPYNFSAGPAALPESVLETARQEMLESLADFDDLTRLFCWLTDKPVGGWRLGAISNAGFECVAIADHADIPIDQVHPMPLETHSADDNGSPLGIALGVGLGVCALLVVLLAARKNRKAYTRDISFLDEEDMYSESHLAQVMKQSDWRPSADIGIPPADREWV